MRGIAAVVVAIGDPWASLFTPPGSPDALLRRGPLRTGRARFPGIRLKQATRAAEVLLKFNAGLVVARRGAAGRRRGRVDRTIARRSGDRLLNDVLFTQRPAGGHEPLFPFRWGLGFIIGAEQLVPADGAAIPLGCSSSRVCWSNGGVCVCAGAQPSSRPGSGHRLRPIPGRVRDGRLGPGELGDRRRSPGRR